MSRTVIGTDRVLVAPERVIASRIDLKPDIMRNGTFESIPSFTAATNTNTRYIDGTAGGSTANMGYGWATISGFGTNTVQFDTSEFHSGAGSMKIVSTAAAAIRVGKSPNSPPANAELRDNHILVTPSTSYTFTGWMKTQYVSGDAASGASFSIRERNGAGTQVAINGTTAIKTTTGWIQYSVTFTTNAATRFLSPELSLTTNDGAGTLVLTAWYDDMEIHRTNPASRTVIS